jgi:hypothetical protein
MLAKLPPDSSANRDVFKLVPAFAVKLVLVNVRLGAVPILKVGVDVNAGNVPLIPTDVGGVKAVIWVAGKTTGVLAAANACPSAGVLVSILASEVFPVVWFADVAAPVGKGKLAALTGCVTPLPSTNKRVAVTVKLLGNLVLIVAKLPPDSNANKDVFKLVPALAVKLVLVKVKLGAVPILNVGVAAKAGNVPVRPTLQVPC